jgi:hypothetical protein
LELVDSSLCRGSVLKIPQQPDTPQIDNVLPAFIASYALPNAFEISPTEIMTTRNTTGSSRMK